MIYGVIIGTILAIVVIIALVSVLPMCFMHPLPSGKIEGTCITVIKNRINNMFFITAGDEWIVIDAGSDADAIMQEMQRLLIDAQKVKYVFLTHTDYDHVAAIPLFPNAAIYMNQQEEQMIDGSTNRQFLKKNKLPQPDNANLVTWMADRETIDCNGLKVQMISAPGHTKGSAMYAVDEKYLFSGDTFKAENGNMLIHPYTMDKGQATKTIQHIKSELGKYEKIFTAHYGSL